VKHGTMRFYFILLFFSSINAFNYYTTNMGILNFILKEIVHAFQKKV
jgi:hypothetical protein